MYNTTSIILSYYQQYSLTLANSQNIQNLTSFQLFAHCNTLPINPEAVKEAIIMYKLHVIFWFLILSSFSLLVTNWVPELTKTKGPFLWIQILEWEL